MSDVARVEGWFADGTLVRPDYERPNIVDLTRAVATICGVPGLELSKNARAMSERIGDAEHLVFVLVDGLGTHQVESLPESSFLRQCMVADLQTVCPTSTAPALTSLATGVWPAQHGTPGWFTYLPEHELTSAILPFVERYTKTPLSRFGIDLTVFPCESMASAFIWHKTVVLPKAIAGSVYSSYLTPGAPQVPYESLQGAVDDIVDLVEVATANTYTYFYIPFVDMVAHQHGPGARPVRETVILVDRALSRLSDQLRGRARLVATADHGLIFTPPERRHELKAGDPLLELLVAGPMCEPRVPAFAVHEGMLDQFAALFRQRFGDEFALLTTDEADDLRLFGPGSLGDVTRSRLGDFVAVGGGTDVLLHRPDDALAGWHGGLTRDEMHVPLILA